MFAVIAALLLVGAIAVGTLLPLGLTLSQAMAMADRTSPGWLHDHSPLWLWTWVEVPFLVRPLWLIPTFLGLVCAGLATTLNQRDVSPRRRRS